MTTATPNADSLSQDIDMRILLDDGRSVPMPCTLAYSVTDPFAVKATFRSTDGSVTWVFARDLLVEGMQGPVGEGDIKVRPIHAVGRSKVRFELSSPAGEAVIEGPADPIASFVSATTDMLPVGFEWQYLNFDSGLQALLDGEIA